MMCRYPSYHSLAEVAVFLGWENSSYSQDLSQEYALKHCFIMAMRQETDILSWSVDSFVGYISSMNPEINFNNDKEHDGFTWV